MVHHAFTEVWAKAIALSWHDAPFKAALLANPAAALAAHFKYTLPPNVVLEVKEGAHNHPIHMTLTIPPKPEGEPDPSQAADFFAC